MATTIVTTGSYRQRDKMLVIQDILQFIEKEQEASRSAIMNGASISYEQLKRYSQFLTEKQLLAMRNGRYYLTKKGTKLLKALIEKERILNS
nr:winged helix-turn-helix domain-containing protein [uncultured Nitrososphaera sp.]